MKFLDSLINKYGELNLAKPQWINEYNAVPTTGSVGAIPTMAPVPQVAQPVASKPSVVDALMKAVQDAGLDKDPDVAKVKTAITQKVADAKKEVLSQGTKVIDTITKTLDTVKGVQTK